MEEKESKLKEGLLREGTLREVEADDLDPVGAVVFTIRETAEALGFTMLTVKSWISKGLIPSPILRDTSYHYDQYSKGELQVIAAELAEHFKVYSQLQKNHTDVIERIRSKVDAYRDQYV